MGLKFTSEDQCSARDEESICSTSDNGSNDVSIENEEKTGQLQVHVVEGAGIVDELTHRPFKTFVKWYGWSYFYSLFVCNYIACQSQDVARFAIGYCSDSMHDLRMTSR